VRLISADPSLVAQILKVINSAYYGIPREIGDLRFAIAYLGLNEIYRLVLSLTVLNTLSIKENDELSKFWFHSYFTALCTKHLAKKFEPLLPMEELWPAAILHDIGKLIYLKFFPNHYQTLRKYTLEHGCLFSEAEIQFDLPASSFLGSLLCDHWGLPSKIKKACELHTLKDLQHSTSGSENEGFTRIICLGNLMAILATDTLNQDKKHEIAETTQKSVNYKEEQFLTLMGEIYQIKLEVESCKLF
jgi:HD-like signal output (HDOD) protein